MIFFRRGEKEGGEKYTYEEQINQAVFPALQGGPHNHQIAGLATQLKEVATPEFKVYIKQVKANASALAKCLISKDYKLATDGTGTILAPKHSSRCGLGVLLVLPDISRGFPGHPCIYSAH